MDRVEKNVKAQLYELEEKQLDIMAKKDNWMKSCGGLNWDETYKKIEIEINILKLILE